MARDWPGHGSTTDYGDMPLGLYRTDPGSAWHWHDGSPFDWTNWDDGEPRDGNFAHMNIVSGKWSVQIGDESGAVTCQRPSC